MSQSPESIRMLTTEAAQLHLDRHNLVTTGGHQELVKQLLRWHATPNQDQSGSETDSHASRPDSDPAPDHTLTEPESQEDSSGSVRKQQ